MRTKIEFVGEVIWGNEDGRLETLDHSNAHNVGRLYPCYLECDDIIIHGEEGPWHARENTTVDGPLDPTKRVRMRIWFGEMDVLCDTDYDEEANGEG